MINKISSAAACVLILIICTADLDARPNTGQVAVVVGENAPELERFAASELCGYLNRLFGLNVQPTTTPDASASAVFLVGTQASNALIKALPKVGEQGVVIKRLDGGTPTLIVGGGSSRATLWAVYALAGRW